MLASFQGQVSLQTPPCQPTRQGPAILALSTFHNTILIGLSVLASASAQTAPTAADSGWVSLYDSTALGTDMFVYKGGYQAIGTQTSFKIENGMIHAGGSYAILMTQKEYGYYRLRVEYRFGEAVGGSANAGMMIAMDVAGARNQSKALRPRSIEINCRRDNNYPWSLWASQDLGPAFETTVQKGSAKYLGKAEGGVAYIVDPSGNRTLESAYPNPELPPGQWNRGLAEVFGDSGVFTLNGKPRTAGWNWKDKIGGARVARGAVGVQTEGSDIWYREWKIQELDSATRVPIHARRGCTDPNKPKFDPRAVVSDGSCGTSALRPVSRHANGSAALAPFLPPFGLLDIAGRARAHHVH